MSHLVVVGRSHFFVVSTTAAAKAPFVHLIIARAFIFIWAKYSQVEQVNGRGVTVNGLNYWGYLCTESLLAFGQNFGAGVLCFNLWRNVDVKFKVIDADVKSLNFPWERRGSEFTRSWRRREIQIHDYPKSDLCKFIMLIGSTIGGDFSHLQSAPWRSMEPPHRAGSSTSLPLSPTGRWIINSYFN